MAKYSLRTTDDFARDLERIADHLTGSYRHFGEDDLTALARVTLRVKGALSFLGRVAKLPHRGTRMPDLGPDIRRVTDDDFAFYFEIDEPHRQVRVLAVFFRGADHRQQVIERLQA